MRNLNLWEVSLNYLQIDPEGCICYNHNEANSGNLFTCSSNLLVSNFSFDGVVKWSKDLTDTLLCKSRPINITYLSLLDTLCVGFENGEIVTISESGSICDIAGVCDKGILAMEWSPDQELLVIITKELNTILMSCTYEPVNEVNLLVDEFGERQFITVGWGKKETQFHGSEGKNAAKINNDVCGDKLTDQSVKISWRGDGNLYAIGFNFEGIRRFKVFDREGHLQYTSEKQQGLESNLSWRPSGNVIATTQKIMDQYHIAFFEKNGLKHGGFQIPAKSNTYVENITWSTDSEILTLQCRNTETDIQEILLFTTSNYHWYHKQTLTFKCHQKINKILWDNDFDVINNKKLHIFLHSGEHYCYTWIWNIDHSKGTGSGDDAVVGVIDGKKLLLTGFRQMVVPPPMSAIEIQFDFPINAVHFAPLDNNSDTNNFFVITADNKISFYAQKKKHLLQYTLQRVTSLLDYEFPFQYYNWFWMNSTTVICVNLDTDQKYNLVEYSLDIYSNQVNKINSAKLPTAVTRIQSHPNNYSKVFMQLNNGEIMNYYIVGTAEPQDLSFAVACPKFSVIMIDNSLHFMGLSHKNNLYINNLLVLNNVTSYFITTHFLLLTTHQHLLLCTELTKSGIGALEEYKKQETSENIFKRKIERGARLVVVVPNDTRAVFQLPRGNIEVIQPRPLSLKLIGEYLDGLKYYDAFDLMRKQRINLNLIHDHDPENFLNNINVFLESIENISWLNLFLSDLEDIDVTRTMYASSYVDKSEKPIFEVKGKTNMVCDVVREHLNQRTDSYSKILPILTAFVKKNTGEDIENALNLIKELKLQEASGKKLPVGTDEALKYLLYMVDVNQLFNVALGMYDFDLVLVVANKSQKDPKEYIPMLNELNDMDENYKRYTINKHLKKFREAIKYLVLCGPDKYEELKTFVKYHSLYREALELFNLQDSIYVEISNDFGLYLCLKKQFIEAGIIFERALNYEKAIECYRNALEWEMALKLVYGKWSPEKFKEICWEFVIALTEEKRHNEALQILQLYYKDDEKSILYAIDCGHYITAFRLCAGHDRGDIRSKNLEPAILDEYKNLKELIENNYNNFIRHRDRLFLVRENKIRNSLETYDAYYRDSDLYSDAGSTLASSRGSSRSFRSSKNKRKHERKLASLKEGSQYEDVALIMTLHNLVISCFDLRLQVRNVNIALGCINKDREAFTLQVTLEKLLKEMKDSFKDIWTSEFLVEATNAAVAAQNVPEGCTLIPQGIATLETHLRIAPVIQDINWKLEGLG